MPNHFHCQRRIIEALGMQVSHQQAMILLQRGFESDHLRVETAHIDKRSICTAKGPKGTSINIRWDVQGILLPPGSHSSAEGV